MHVSASGAGRGRPGGESGGIAAAVPDRPRSPTRTTPHPPSRAITPIPTGPGAFLVRKAQYWSLGL